MLLPQLPLGKTKTPTLTSDHRAAVQEAIKVFVDQFNAVHCRGFVIHGSRIYGCPFDEEILVMPFAVGGSFDAVGAWIWLNMMHSYCCICPADYSLCWEYAPQPLPPRDAVLVAKLRRDANPAFNSVKARADRHAARVTLKLLALHPDSSCWLFREPHGVPNLCNLF